MITSRQGLILEKIIKDYINFAEPIGSEFLDKKHNLPVSPATIRLEMQKLTDEGFLYQPHTSAGRVPTDKGYRFFVDKLLENGLEDFKDKRFFEEIREIKKEIEDHLKFSQEMTKLVSSFSSGLILNYSADDNILWKEGWQKVFKEPEFEDSEYTRDFVATVEKLENEMKNFFLDDFNFQVFIGKENPISKAKNFSLIVSKSKTPKKQKRAVAILGPKRMAYDKNISLINSLMKLFDNF
jgi:heat-inducible transcriptional repressor